MRALFSLAPCRNDNEPRRWIRPLNKVFILNIFLPIFVFFASRRRLLSFHHESDRLDWKIRFKSSIIKPRPISPLSALSSLLLRLSWTLCAVQLFSISNITQCLFAKRNKTTTHSQIRHIYCMHPGRLYRGICQWSSSEWRSIDSCTNLCASGLCLPLRHHRMQKLCLQNDVFHIHPAITRFCEHALIAGITIASYTY